MRKRFLVLSCVAAMSLASLASSAFAAATATLTIDCTTYSKSYQVTVPPNFRSYTYHYSYTTLDGTFEYCTVTIS